jgi:RNA polymerase sigma factor (sigma-70 family)
MMDAEARGAEIQPDPARSYAAAHPAAQHGRSGHTGPDPRTPMRTRPDPVRNDPVVIELVIRARDGDQHAWDALVERYAPLIWSICHRHRLGDADAEDVGQSVWLQLVSHLQAIREPAALPGWLATVARRECARVLRTVQGPLAAGYVRDAEILMDEHARTAEQWLLVAERHAALREAFQGLPSCGQQLIALLLEDPPVPYAEISARLGIPVGSIGPKRSRLLGKLRHHPAIVALIDADGSAA